MKYGSSAITPEGELYAAYVKEPYVFESEPAIERPLGATENLYWRFDRVSPLNFGSVVRLQGEIDHAHMRKALHAIQARHPLLRVKIECDAKGRPWFRSGVGEIAMDVLEASHDQVWPTLEKAVNAPVDTVNGPLMRCLLLKHGPADSTLVMNFHHAVSDGKSSIFLARDILQSLARQHRGMSAKLEALQPVGYYGNRIPKLEPWAGKESMKTAWKTLKGVAQFLEGVGFPTGLQRYKDPEFKAAPGVMLEPRIIEKAQMQALLQKTKAENATLQCVLNAALSLTVAEDSPTGMLQRTACSQVLDVRCRLEPPVGEDCGLFCSGATSLHTMDASTPFWPLTRKIHEQLQHSIATPMPFFHPAMHRQAIRLGHGLGLHNYKAFGEYIGRLHPEGLAVSNLGRVTIDVDGPVKAVEFGFGTNTTALNYLSTSAATFDGRMTWVFNGGTELMTRERLKAIADRSVERMMAAIHE
ncbi:Hypothetical protein HDN1F_13180 [gamma proteobacterium HdN1]|nr:Hypothetical protein HDN1F_13180 [gamma proteobacterium HdN1]